MSMPENATMMPIGRAAAAAGVNVQTLHYYERRGLLRPTRRGGSTYRQYGAADVVRIRAIKRAQALGFTLEEISELLHVGRGRAPVPRARSLATAKLEEIDGKIRDLERMRAALTDVVETCRCGGKLVECKVLDALGASADAASESAS